jgi:putative FmdB family regulatory protein
MPTYQYACTECGHAFEQVQKFTDDSLTECPQCHGRLRKVFNAVGVVFKGSGFYRTDSRGSSSSSETSSTAKTETKSESAPAKTESKPAAPAAKSTSSSD